MAHTNRIQNLTQHLNDCQISQEFEAACIIEDTVSKTSNPTPPTNLRASSLSGIFLIALALLDAF